ncbi:hypothetical protein B0T25DRAFT_553179 [Lasiosphaeria hispida]|uniref:Uncharacterized protein n=1 Tax=Lasiosphaeria hispida TaxID=260671 RepID=A0AAJ0HCQ0_9PEZI|nr:hypothetical protein B0T25DRAFT_553179 [Lasiosphaeria hispida]
MGDAVAPAARKSCSRCHTDQDIDQYYDLGGNGRVVAVSLTCRNRMRGNHAASRSGT